MMEILEGKYGADIEESDTFNHADKSTIDYVLILQKALLNLINTKVGLQLMNHHVAVRVITDTQTKQCTGVKKDKKRDLLKREPRY